MPRTTRSNVKSHNNWKKKIGSLYKSYSIEEYLEDIKNYETLSDSNKRELIFKYRETGDINIRNKLFTSHLKLIITICKSYIKDSYWLKFPEIVQEANLGFFEALNNFNLNYKATFNTLLSQCVKHKISRAIAKNYSFSGIKIGENAYYEALDLSRNPNGKYKNKKRTIDAFKVIRLKTYQLIACESDEETNLLDDYEDIEIYDNIDQFNFIYDEYLNKLINDGLIDSRSKDIISYRILDNLTFSEIGIKFNRSPKIVRNIYKKTLTVLRENLSNHVS